MPILRDTEGKDGNYPSTLPAFLSEFLSMETVGPVHLGIWKLQIQPANCTLIEGTWTSAGSGARGVMEPTPTDTRDDPK